MLKQFEFLIWHRNTSVSHHCQLIHRSYNTGCGFQSRYTRMVNVQLVFHLVLAPIKRTTSEIGVECRESGSTDLTDNSTLSPALVSSHHIPTPHHHTTSNQIITPHNTTSSYHIISSHHTTLYIIISHTHISLHHIITLYHITPHHITPHNQITPHHTTPHYIITPHHITSPHFHTTSYHTASHHHRRLLSNPYVWCGCYTFPHFAADETSINKHQIIHRDDKLDRYLTRFITNGTNLTV